jgi:hypothetical protein
MPPIPVVGYKPNWGFFIGHGVSDTEVLDDACCSIIDILQDRERLCASSQLRTKRVVGHVFRGRDSRGRRSRWWRGDGDAGDKGERSRRHRARIVWLSGYWEKEKEVGMLLIADSFFLLSILDFGFIWSSSSVKLLDQICCVYVFCFFP